MSNEENRVAIGECAGVTNQLTHAVAIGYTTDDFYSSNIEIGHNTICSYGYMNNILIGSNLEGKNNNEIKIGNDEHEKVTIGKYDLKNLLTRIEELERAAWIPNLLARIEELERLALVPGGAYCKLAENHFYDTAKMTSTEDPESLLKDLDEETKNE